MVVPTRYNRNESVVSCIVREADKAWRSTGVIVLLVQTYSPWPRGKPVEVVGNMQVVYYYPIDTNHTNSLMTCKNLMSIKNIKQILSPIGEYNIKNSVKICIPRSIVELKEKLKTKMTKFRNYFLIRKSNLNDIIFAIAWAFLSVRLSDMEITITLANLKASWIKYITQAAITLMSKLFTINSSKFNSTLPSVRMLITRE